MRKSVLRVYPKLKIFVNGEYPYNPIIDWSDVKMYDDMMSSDTEWISRSNSGKYANPEHVMYAIGSRARAAVMRRETIRKLVRERNRG